MGFCQKNTFLQLKHIQQIYLTLLSTICVQIHQITCVICETICHFSQHNSSVSFQLKHQILSTKLAHQSTHFKSFPLLRLKFTKFLMSFLEQRISFSSNFASLFSVMSNSSVLFHLNICMLCPSRSNQSANFGTFNCSNENWPNCLCHFSTQSSQFSFKHPSVS